MAENKEKAGQIQPENRSVSPYLLRPARTYEEYLRNRRDPAKVPAKFDESRLRRAEEN